MNYFGATHECTRGSSAVLKLRAFRGQGWMESEMLNEAGFSTET